MAEMLNGSTTEVLDILKAASPNWLRRRVIEMRIPQGGSSQSATIAALHRLHSLCWIEKRKDEEPASNANEYRITELGVVALDLHHRTAEAVEERLKKQ